MPHKTTSPVLKNTKSSIKLPNDSLIKIFRSVADKNKDKNALFFKGKFTTYKDLDERINRLSHAFKEFGVKKGDRIMVMMPNCPQYVALFYATQALGAIFVSVNPMLSSRELGSRMKDCTPKVFVTFDMFLDKVKALDEEIAVDYLVVGSVADELPSVTKALYKLINLRKEKTVAGAFLYKDLIENSQNTRINTKIDAKKDVAVLQYTGGTTGEAKGAMLTHYNLSSQTHIVHHWRHQLKKTPKGQFQVAGVLPYTHIFGLTSSFLWPIFEGATIYLIPDPRKLEEVLKTIDRYKIHFLNCVPVFFQKIAEHKNLSKYDLSSLHLCLSGGEGLPQKTSDAFESVVDCLLVEGYGLTEASPVTHINPPDEELRRIGSIGLPIPLTEAKVVNPETGRELKKPGKEGELCIRGPGVMKGYWNNKEATDDVIKDGWLRTGDMVQMDKEGYFTVVDRIKELIIVSGFKVWPREIEDVIRTHPHVDEAVIVPMLTEKGTKVRAVLVKKPESKHLSLDELREFCKSQLAPYKIPKALEYTDEVPRSMVGKVLRREVLRLIEERLSKGASC